MLAPLNTLGVRFEPFLRVVLQGCYWSRVCKNAVVYCRRAAPTVVSRVVARSKLTGRH